MQECERRKDLLFVTNLLDHGPDNPSFALYQQRKAREASTTTPGDRIEGFPGYQSSTSNYYRQAKERPDILKHVGLAVVILAGHWVVVYILASWSGQFHDPPES